MMFHKLFLHNLRYVIGQALYAILGPTYPASNVVTTKKILMFTGTPKL